MRFVPAHRPGMVAKTLRHRPDLVVVDLKDAVPVADKGSARRLAMDALTRLDPPPGTAVVVRGNPVETPWFTEDVAAAAGLARAGDSKGTATGREADT